MNEQEQRKAPTPASKTNLILAALLISVCGFAYWLEVRKKPEMRKADEEKGRLLALDDTTEVESVTVVDREKNVDIELKCSANCRLNQPNSEWRIVKPISFKADEANVGTFITGLAASNVVETLPVEGDIDSKLQEFGLGKSKREETKVVLKLKKDAEPYTLFVGENAAVGENMYVYFTGPGQKKDVVKIVPSYLKTNMQRDVSYWRSKKLFEFATSEVEGIKLQAPKGTIEVTRDGSNWFLQPGKRPADNESVDTFITGLVFMNAQEFLSDRKDEDRSKLGIPASKPHYNLTIKVAKKPQVNVEIYDFVRDKEPKLYAVFADRPYIVQLERNHAEKFAKGEDAFRMRNLLTSTEKAELGAFTVKLGGKESYEFKNDKGKWSLVSGKIDKVSPEAIDQALTKLGSARVAEFMGKRPLPKDTPELSRWKLIAQDGKPLRELVIYGSRARNEYYVRLPSGEFAKLEATSSSVVPATAVDFQQGASAQPTAPPVAGHPKK